MKILRVFLSNKCFTPQSPIDIIKGGEDITEKEMLKLSVEEFSRLQDYMIESDKDSNAYKRMKRRYIELKVILTASGINISELDYIKE